MDPRRFLGRILAVLLLSAGASALANELTLNLVTDPPLAGLGSAFTYQGRLSEGSKPASGVYDFTFTLLDSAGIQKGLVQAHDDVAVSDGLFTVKLDFGSGVF